MNKILSMTEKLSHVAAWLSGSLLFLSSIMIAVEVVLRKAFAISIGGADELSSYALAISCTWGFSYALFKKSHIRIDVLYSRLPQLWRFILDVVSNILLLLYIATLCYFAFLVLKTSVVKLSAANTPLSTPLWLPQSLWFAGLLFFGMSILVILVATLYNWAQGNHEAATKLSGISTLTEEIEESTEIPKEVHMPGGERS